MDKLKTQLFIILTLTLSTSKALSSEAQYWTSLQINAALKNDFSLYGEFINRYSEESKEFVTRSNRLGVGYKLSSNLTYTFIVENRATNSDSNDEIRFINQLQHKNKFEHFNLTSRFRLENREFSNTPVFALRGRLLLRADVEKLQFYSIVPFFTYEQFYTFNDTVGRPEGSTERRGQAGLNFPINSLDASAELAYLDRIVERSAGQGLSKSSSTYSILNLALKWSY